MRDNIDNRDKRDRKLWKIETTRQEPGLNHLTCDKQSIALTTKPLKSVLYYISVVR